MKKIFRDNFIMLLAGVMLVISITSTLSLAQYHGHVCCGSKCPTCEIEKSMAETSNGLVVVPAATCYFSKNIQHEEFNSFFFILTYTTLVTLNVLIQS